MKTRRIVFLTFVIAGFLVYLLLYQFFKWLWSYTEIKYSHFFGTIPYPVLISFLLSLGIVIYLFKNEKSINFVDEVVSELKMVTWPSRTETIGSTIVVIVTVVIVSIFLGFFDFLWAKLSKLILYSPS